MGTHRAQSAPWVVESDKGNRGYEFMTFDLEMGREDARCMGVSWQSSQTPLLNVFNWGNVTFLWLIYEPKSIIYGC